MKQESSNQLVEHFFRHEYGNMVSVLTRAFGVSKIGLVEDMVSSAMIEAMNSWKQNGYPENPSGWIHRVARNRILDHLRREKAHQKAIAFVGTQHPSEVDASEGLIEGWFAEDAIADSLLRMMLICCHPAVDQKTQIALTLKILCGFSISEISRGLLLSQEAVKKRIQRGKKQLAELNPFFEFPTPSQIQPRMVGVLHTLYLLFNEGYSTTAGHQSIRDDICEESTRLCHLICNDAKLGSPESNALLALMLFHSARLDARTDQLGNSVLLADQDRSQWDQKLIQAGKYWLIKASSPRPSRYHFEAVISQFHCVAKTFEDTDWDNVIRFYNELYRKFPSPVYLVNRAIAKSEAGQVESAIEDIKLAGQSDDLKDYFLLKCAAGHVYEKAGQTKMAIDSFLAALSADVPIHQKEILNRRLKRLTSKMESV